MADDDLRALLGKLIDAFEAEREVNAREREVNAREREVNAREREVNAREREENKLFRVEMRARLEGIDRRLDDQSRTMSALIPARIAAVPPAAE